MAAANAVQPPPAPVATSVAGGALYTSKAAAGGAWRRPLPPVSLRRVSCGWSRRPTVRPLPAAATATGSLSASSATRGPMLTHSRPYLEQTSTQSRPHGDPVSPQC